MKIALAHFNLATESGDPKMVFSIAQGLKKLGHDVMVYCAEFDAKACFPRLNRGLDIRVIPPSSSLASVRSAAGIAGKVRERIKQIRLYNELVQRMANEIDKDLDFIICENDYSYKLGYFYKKMKPDTKVVWIMNNPPFFHSPKDNVLADILSRWAAWFEKMSSRHFGKGVDWVIVYDDESRRLAEAVGRPMKIARNPIDVDYFYAPPKRGIAGKRLQLLGVGALSPQRRFEDMIAAVALLRKKGYDARAVLICKDFWGNKAYRGAFEGFMRSSGVAEYIDARFSGASEEEYLQVVRASDIFVLPNNIKIWGVGAFEAMAAGLPLIVSRATAVAEVLRDDKEALFVDVVRPDQIAEKVELLVKDPELYIQVASAGQECVRQEMGLDNFVKGILAPPRV